MSGDWTDDLVGMTENNATETAAFLGCDVRIGRRDGQSFVVTLDYRPDRVTFNVENGVVVAASVG